jgi:hypothetical protein
MHRIHGALRTKYVIATSQIGSRDLVIEATTELEAAEIFCRMIGLVMFDTDYVQDLAGKRHFKFTLGSGAKFICYDETYRHPKQYKLPLTKPVPVDDEGTEKDFPPDYWDGIHRYTPTAEEVRQEELARGIKDWPAEGDNPRGRKPRRGEPGWSTATDAPPGVEG